MLCCFLLEHPKYTESNCIHRVVGGCKMPIYWAKHEYIQYCLYILSPTSCSGNTPVTVKVVGHVMTMPFLVIYNMVIIRKQILCTFCWESGCSECSAQ